jgi:hypothetical protein
MCSNNRGFIFSLDALIAVIILVIFAADIAFLSSGSSDASIGKLLLKKQAADLLASMDRSGMLASMDAGNINSTLEIAIPPGTGYNLEIDYYEYDYSHSSSGGAFFPENTFIFSDGDADAATQEASSQRNFVVIRGGATPQFGVATLTLWNGG